MRMGDFNFISLVHLGRGEYEIHYIYDNNADGFTITLPQFPTADDLSYLIHADIREKIIDEMLGPSYEDLQRDETWSEDDNDDYQPF